MRARQVYTGHQRANLDLPAPNDCRLSAVMILMLQLQEHASCEPVTTTLLTLLSAVGIIVSAVGNATPEVLAAT